ncbi:hypothetical protein [Actinosynnema sp. NPDC023587]
MTPHPGTAMPTTPAGPSTGLDVGSRSTAPEPGRTTIVVGG